MPCLNEAETLGICIRKARRAFRESEISGEIIVADNGSTDGSIQIAKSLGARVVHVREKGYGCALMGGIDAARGRYVIMGDADDSYDFLEIPAFLRKLRQGYDLVQGCRLPRGGGQVLPGAMPLLHRWLGNPMFSLLARKMFNVPINDIYCGLRGFSSESYHRLGLRSRGMEFATEMIIRGSMLGLEFAEVPITLHPDGRKSHAPHLRTFRDGWRTLRFFLMSSPRWLFQIPGVLLCLLGVLGYALALPGITVFGASLDAHTLLFASLAILLGCQSVQFSVVARTLGVVQGYFPPSPRLEALLRAASLERGLTVGACAFAGGLSLLVLAFWQWWTTGFGPLDYAATMRIVIPGVTLAALGFQTILSSFLLCIVGMSRT
jgi:hypothetical protein